MAVIDFANPTRFLRIAERVLPWLVAATVILFVVGLYRAINAPDDYQQGATVKIMFLHVPAASTAADDRVPGNRERGDERAAQPARRPG